MSYETGAIVLACDIDDTLLAVGSRSPMEQLKSAADLTMLCQLIESERADGSHKLYFGAATGRSLASQTERAQQSPAFADATALMDFSINSVGSAIALATPHGLQPVAQWPEVSNWSADTIAHSLLQRPELSMQPAEGQDTYKVSFDVQDVSDDNHEAYVQAITAQLAAEAMPAQVLFSGGQFLDILPPGVHKGTALVYTAGALAVAHEDSEPMLRIAAGDSMNDLELIAAADKVILPGNAHDSLRNWAENNTPPDSLYMAHGRFAAGIIEGYQHFMQV